MAGKESNMNTRSRLDRINCDMLTPIVQRVLGSPNVKIMDWDYHIIKGDWTSSGRLVCRIFGRTKLHDEEIPWSVFLKIPNPIHTHFDAWHREPFQREPLLYQSGVLDNLPGGISAPRCLSVVEYSDDEPWMWLEDVVGEPALKWPLEQFRITARRFGMMQGAFLAGVSLPDHSWMDTSGWLKLKLDANAAPVPPIMERFQSHPLTRRLYNSEIGEGLRRLWDERLVFFDALYRLPRSFCHGDFNYTNLIARRLLDSGDQIVAVDWQYAGLRQIGEDIAGFIADSSVIPVRRKAAEPKEFTELILEGYLSGLRKSGWKADPRIARFACIARLALPWSFNLLCSLNGEILSQPFCAENRSEMEAKLVEYIHRQRFLLKLAEEARELLEIVKFC